MGVTRPSQIAVTIACSGFALLLGDLDGPAVSSGTDMICIVTEYSIKYKCMDCVEACPVDYFHVGLNMLVLHPDKCIDGDPCEPKTACLPSLDAPALSRQTPEVGALCGNPAPTVLCGGRPVVVVLTVITDANAPIRTEPAI